MLQRLQSEANQDEYHSENSHPLLGCVVSEPLNDRNTGADDQGEHSNHPAQFQSDAERDVA